MIKNKKIVASIEARMTSSRLPGKVLMNAIDEVSMLEFMIHRVKLSNTIDDIIVATTVNKADLPIINLCKKLNVKYYRGSENDVLLRVLEAHKSINSDVIVELTGDCQLIDYKIIDECVSIYSSSEYDYVSNCHVRSYPIGLDVQVFSTDLLNKISKIALEDEDREHVSLYIYKSGKYKLKELVAKDELFWPDLRITLDDLGDYKLLKNIITHFYPTKGFDFSSLEVINYIKNNIKVLEYLKDVRIKSNIYEIVAKKETNDL